MSSIKTAILTGMAMLCATVVFAMHHTPEDRGKALFNDPKLGGGTAGMSCNTCHPDGKGLQGAGAKKEWKTPGGSFKTLEDTVNICITMALKGKALDVKSEQMKDLVSYLKTIKAKSGEAPKKKAPVGC
jgi:cytochrome c peroxidase